MPAFPISIAPRHFETTLEAEIVGLELDWLEEALRDAHAPGFLSDPASFKRFDDAWLRLERLALSMGMPEGQGDGVVAWAEDYLRRHGRDVPHAAALTVGTPEYRRRHIAMIWQAQLWHEAIMILAGVGAIGLLFYAIAHGMQSWM